MIIHPQFDPVALQLGPLAIRWYALSYIVGFVLFMWLGRYRINKAARRLPWKCSTTSSPGACSA